MKPTFENLPEEKRLRIIRACIDEFGERGYDAGSVDGIIKRAGISKGGLYEYVTSKEELFLYIAEYTYGRLYDYLRDRIQTESAGLPKDLLERLRHVSELAVDFYLEHPEFIYFIVRTYNLPDERLDAQIKSTFTSNFLDLFGDIGADRLRFPKERILELAMWLLLKTRYDFLTEIRTEGDTAVIKRDYMQNWDFYLSVLRNGIYG
jgi:TetR/AcrR family transcriptional regulator